MKEKAQPAHNNRILEKDEEQYLREIMKDKAELNANKRLLAEKEEFDRRQRLLKQTVDEDYNRRINAQKADLKRKQKMRQEKRDELPSDDLEDFADEKRIISEEGEKDLEESKLKDEAVSSQESRVEKLAPDEEKKSRVKLKSALNDFAEVDELVTDAIGTPIEASRVAEDQSAVQ